jgi:glycosyltransferase EpsE
MPKISVIMGVYNGEVHLRTAIESILNQTFMDFEFIICDDGSKDDSAKIVSDYAMNDNRIVLIRNQINLGLAASLNKCIDVAKSELIARMDADDISHANRLEIQFDYLMKNSNIDILGTAIKVFDGRGSYGFSYKNKSYNKANVFRNNFFFHPTVMMKKSMLIAIKGYTVENYTYRTEDYDLWCKAVYNGFIGFNLSTPLLDYRQDRNSYSKRKFKYRIHAVRLKLFWFKKLRIPVYMFFSVFKPVLVGLIPVSIMMVIHKSKQKRVHKI